jgi:hypothetical protein
MILKIRLNQKEILLIFLQYIEMEKNEGFEFWRVDLVKSWTWLHNYWTLVVN